MNQMSMIGNFISLSDEELNNLIVSPEKLPDFLSEKVDILNIDQAWQEIHEVAY